MAEGFLYVLLDGIYNMANDVVLTLIKHTVLSSLYDCFVTTALHLSTSVAIATEEKMTVGLLILLTAQ